MAGSKRRRFNAEGGRALIERLDGSGLSVSAFCEREGISRASLYRWRSIVSRGAARQPQQRVAPAPTVAESRPTDFIDLGALAGGGGRIELKLDLGGGVLLHVVRG